MASPRPRFEIGPFFHLQEGLLAGLKREYLRRELWLPLKREGDVLTVLIADPDNLPKRDTVAQILKGKEIRFVRAAPEEILQLIDRAFDGEEMGSAIRQEATRAEAEGDARLPTESDSVIVRLVNRIINDAYDRRASDIHIEPDVKDRDVKVRIRVDGECLPLDVLPFEYRSAVVSRIKIMSNLDITERRLPQDGKIAFRRPDGEEIELRVATIPTHGYVEDVVLRILTKGRIMTLEELAMEPETYEGFLNILKKPYGLILIVGPTGSGKTTTAHAALHILNRPNTKIWTAEDPVEIAQQGIRQVQVHHKIGYDFKQAMRAFLRADPDIIMVGEMRDYETAKMGIEASLTGHLVLSTLHTNNAPETIVRLLDMGIDPFAFADSLLCVLAQRLVRSLCVHCREEYHPSREEYDELARHYDEKYFAALNVAYDERLRLFRPRGCPECNHTGYRGRMGLFELLVVTDQIKHHIINKKSIPSLRRTALNEGMRTLLQDGIRKILQGRTDLMEVLSVCMR
ncbi:MAG TPA: GspE/PulE family protein [Syntrophales bacterium]|nr:GspE/PulE family protein [Syntrophales bacterium]HOM06331.1 GspE/PulE family protein [Syntrophales bacterium]HON99230.1 GspE/PulE family protein [Syntrophales bacterium]HPC00055.1 GspE/PulE family protein [Syntrophales bacterium]HPQ05688.1 GspE/PulE family protein [Syntrophales bacterium]